MSEASPWADYLTAVEAAALEVRESIAAGREPQLPTLQPPAEPPGDADEPRRAKVAELLAEVTAFVTQQQEQVRLRLEHLPRRAPRSNGYAGGGFGAQLDLNG